MSDAGVVVASVVQGGLTWMLVIQDPRVSWRPWLWLMLPALVVLWWIWNVHWERMCGWLGDHLL